MKKAIIFFFVYLISVSLFGQITKKSLQENERIFNLKNNFEELILGNSFNNKLQPLRFRQVLLSDQQIDSIIVEKYDLENELWINSSKYEYKYFNIDTVVTIYIWEKSNNQWIRNYKKEYLHNNTGRISQTREFSWIDTTNTWLPEEYIQYIYNGNITQKIISTRNENANDVNYSWKYEYTYDYNGNISQEIYYNWSGYWENIAKTEYQYDSL